MGVGVDAGYLLVVEVEGNCGLAATVDQVEDGEGICMDCGWELFFS